MRKFITFLLGAMVLFSAVSPVMAAAQAATVKEQQALVQRLKGYFLLAVEDQGSLWYVLPETGERLPISDKATLQSLIQFNVVSVTSAQLAQLPTKKQAFTSAAVKTAVAKNKGRFVSASKTWQTMWYVNPADGLRYDVSNADKAYGLAVKKALGVSNANLALIPSAFVQPLIEDVISVDPILPPLETVVTYQNADMGFDFATRLMAGYEQYHRAFNDWPDIKWFGNIIEWNLPIYLNENGFSLDSGKQNFFVWTTATPEWRDFYYNHFSWKREGDMISARFDLPQAVDTAQYGFVKAGTYYISNEYGLQGETSFQKATGTYVMTMEEKKADATRVFESALAVMNALDRYNYDNTSFPTAHEHAIELGEPGARVLGSNGFENEATGDVLYLNHIASGRPSTTIVYDSLHDAKWYTLTFTIYAQYKNYEPGVYVIEPYRITRIAPAPSK